MSATTKATVRVEVTEVGSGDLGTPRKQHTFEDILSMASGTSASQSDLVWSDQRTLSTASENLDLAGGLNDAFGAAITFAEVTFLGIRIVGETTGEYLLVGGAAANAWEAWVAAAGDKIKVGREFALGSSVDGYAVTAGTGDILKIEAVGSVTYDIIIIGRSA